MSKVSVIIPTYNRADKIADSINSVLRQTYKGFKLLVVDDASSDKTECAVKQLDDARIEYHRLDKNMGAAGARNEGVRLSDSEFVAFHDSDDKWFPDKLEKQLDYMDTHPDCGMVYGKIRVNTPEKIYLFPNETVCGLLEGELYPWLLKRNTIDAPTMLIRKRCFDEAGGFDPSLRCLEDWEFAVRFSRLFNIGYIDEPLIDSYVSDDGVSHNISAYYETRCKIIALHREEIIRLGLFDEIVMDVFSRAEKSGIMAQVQKMLMYYLSM